MRCPSCSFENPDDEERCFRCGAFLGQLAEGDLTPPRGKKNSPSRLWGELQRLNRIYRGRRGIDAFLEPTGKYSFMVPVLASAILPGMGQLINRKPIKALLFFISFVFILGWGYATFYNGYFPLKYTFPIFVHFMGSASYYPIIFYTWIVYDAYNDGIKAQERRSVGVVESFLVSLLISLLAILITLTLQNSFGTGYTMEHLLNVGSLRQFDLADGDELILDHDYYGNHEVKVGHFVPYSFNGIIRVGRDNIRGPLPSVVLALPGEYLRFTNRGIYSGKTRLAALPLEWERAFKAPVDFRVPDDKYYLLPAYIGPFSDHNICLCSKGSIGGKYIMIFQPARRRRLLP
jgi:hypothetical protein